MIYAEMKLFTEFQVITVEPDIMLNGVILAAKERNSEECSGKMHLNIDQIKSLIKILEFQLTEILNQKS